MNQNLSCLELIKKMIQWRKPMLLLTSIATALSVVVCFLIAPQYKSTSIIFPVRQFSVAKLLIEQNVGNQEDYMQIGDEDDAEKVIQVLTSETIKHRVAERFNLWDRWKITKNAYASHNLRQKWDNMVKIKRTDFNSIKVETHDYTANGAAEICNGIVEECDSIRKHMNLVVAQKAFAIVKEEYENTITRMNELEDSLQTLRKLGVLDYKADVNAYTKSYAKALEKGNNSAIKALESKLDVLKTYGGAYLHVSENLRKYRFKFPVIKSKYDDALVNLHRYMPFVFVLEKGEPDEFKSRPFKSLIVLITLISTFLFTFMILLLKENFIKIKKDLNLNS